MKIWIIEQGRSIGPLDFYQIASRLRNGSLDPSTHAWHEGETEWKKISEMALFESVLHPPSSEQNADAEPTTIFDVDARDRSPMPQLLQSELPQPAVFRRFFARIFDLCLWHQLVLCLLFFSGHDVVQALLNGWFNIALLLAWLPVEALMLQHFRSTPGKFLLGLSVHFASNEPPSFWKCLQRTAHVMIMGLGFTQPFAMPFCLAVSFWFTRKSRESLWDRMVGTRLDQQPHSMLRWLGMAVIFTALSGLSGFVLQPVSDALWRELHDRYPQLHQPSIQETKHFRA